MKKLISKITGDPQTRALKRLTKRVPQINELESKYKKMTDDQLRESIDVFHEKASKGADLDTLLPDVFAIVRETSKRILGQRHYDVQLIGGMALHAGTVAEMRTGEGKTLVATLPLVLNGLTDKGAHLVTVNDYLAQRDAGWNAGIYHFLGLSTGVIIPSGSFIYDPEYTNEEHEDDRFRHLKPCTRSEAYGAHITYGTNNEFGFDYLRDNMSKSKSQLRQRPLNYAIVDEVDSILIDEARTPLIISAPASESNDQYIVFSKAVKKLTPDDYELDEKRRSVAVNDQGIEKIEKLLKIDNIYDAQNVQSVYHLEQALKAELVFKKDKDYVVRDGEVVIVDEFTGRVMEGRRYSEGLHQAIEAKENVAVLQESMTLATISFQNYFRLYDKLSGMTGTANTEAEEFYTIYKLDVVVIPTNKPVIRDDHPDRIYKSEMAKFRAVAKDAKEKIEAGRAVLIGTVSVEKNELMSTLLTQEGIKHELLNAKNHEREAAIVEAAGKSGAVTLATNIAGRGTDIKLSDEVKEAGGLHVIGTERHESRRIDNQLRGRGGRQGDPGSTRFYVSADDDLMRIFGGDRVASLMSRTGLDDETPIENRVVSRALEGAQKKVENFHFDSRKDVVSYDDVMNRQRKAIYARRRLLLEQDDIHSEIDDLIKEEVSTLGDDIKSGVDTKDVIAEAKTIFPISPRQEKQLKESSDFSEVLLKIAHEDYAAREERFTPEIMRLVEREIYMSILDDLWMQHLENMDHMRQGIKWRSVGQRDPLVEYRREAKVLYESLLAALRTTVVKMLYRAEPRVQESDVLETALTRAAEQSSEGSADVDGAPSKTKQKRSARAEKTPSPVKPSTKAKKKTKKKQRQNRKKSRK